jgi:nucleoside phosphorylase
MWKEVGDARHTHVYREATMVTNSGANLRVIATTSTSMGLTAAAIATTHLILQFRPKLVAMIGIAAGTRSGGKQYGDVLVADPSIDYNSGKVVFENGVRGFQPDPTPSASTRDSEASFRNTAPLLSSTSGRSGEARAHHR